MDAREIFAELRAGGWSLLEKWVTEQVTESVTLDFKEVRADMTQKDALSADDRDGLAKNISGFANTEGGVLVFGIEARSVAKGPDVIQALKPIRGLARFTDFVKAGAKSLVEPKVGGVDVRRAVACRLDTGVALSGASLGVSSELERSVRTRRATRTASKPRALHDLAVTRHPSREGEL